MSMHLAFKLQIPADNSSDFMKVIEYTPVLKLKPVPTDTFFAIAYTHVHVVVKCAV